MSSASASSGETFSLWLKANIHSVKSYLYMFKAKKINTSLTLCLHHPFLTMMPKIFLQLCLHSHTATTDLLSPSPCSTPDHPPLLLPPYLTLILIPTSNTYPTVTHLTFHCVIIRLCFHIHLACTQFYTNIVYSLPCTQDTTYWYIAAV